MKAIIITLITAFFFDSVSAKDNSVVDFLFSQEMTRSFSDLNKLDEFHPDVRKSRIRAAYLISFAYWYSHNKGDTPQSKEVELYSRRLSKMLKKRNFSIREDFISIRNLDSKNVSLEEIESFYEMICFPVDRQDFIQSSKYENVVDDFIKWFKNV